MNRRKSPSGRIHIEPGDTVRAAGGRHEGVVVMLDSRESHEEALVRWGSGLRIWESLNALVFVRGKP